MTVYPPQLESWDGHRLAVYAAIALKEKPDSTPVFGVVWMDGPTVVDKEAPLVTFFDAQVRKVSFPTKPALDGPVLQQRTGTLDQQRRGQSEGAQPTGGYDSARTSGYDSTRTGGYDSTRTGGYDSTRTGGYDSARASGYGQGYRTGGGGTRTGGTRPTGSAPRARR